VCYRRVKLAADWLDFAGGGLCCRLAEFCSSRSVCSVHRFVAGG